MSKLNSEEMGIFVDRESSLSALQQLFKQVVETESGRAVFVSGQPGIGKTALVERFLTTIPKESAVVLRARGREFAASPFVALAGLFEEASILQPARYGKQVAFTVLNVARLIPAFGNYASVVSDVAKDWQGLSQADSRVISTSLYVNSMITSLLEKLAKKRPVVLFLDDAQWFDSSSLEVLGFAAGRLSALRVLLIVCFRRGHVTSEREEQNVEILNSVIRALPKEISTSIGIEPLDDENSGELVKRFLKGRDDEAGTRIVVRRGGGNPLFISKLTQELLGSLGAFTTEGGLETVIPPTLYDTFTRQLRRIDRDDPDARLVLDYAAVLGREFSLTDIAALATSDPLRLKHTLERLNTIYGVINASNLPENYEFDHEMTREAIERDLGERAGRLHLKAAEHFESQPSAHPELLAIHYEKAHAYERALVQYRKAAEGASKSYSFADAVRYLEKCLTLIEDRVRAPKGTRRKLVLALAEAEFATGRFEKSLANALSVVKSGSASSPVKANALLLAGRCTRYLGATRQGKKGIKYLKEAVTIYDANRDIRNLATAYSALATVLDHFNFHDEAVSYFGKCQKALNQSRDRTGLATLQRKSGMIYDSRMAIPFIKHALTVFERAGSKIEVGRCLNNLGAEMFYIGDFKEAEIKLLKAVESYREIDSYEIDAPLNNLGLVYMQEGRLADSRAMLEETEKRASEDFDRICAVSNAAVVERLEGNLPKALGRLHSIEELVEGSGEPLIQDYFAFNFATTLLKSGKPMEALDWLGRYPLNSWKGDSNLAEAKRLRAKGIILQAIGKQGEAKVCISRADEILNTRRPQRWFYELDYYPCDIHILD